MSEIIHPEGYRLPIYFVAGCVASALDTYWIDVAVSVCQVTQAFMNKDKENFSWDKLINNLSAYTTGRGITFGVLQQLD